MYVSAVLSNQTLYHLKRNIEKTVDNTFNINRTLPVVYFSGAFKQKIFIKINQMQFGTINLNEKQSSSEPENIRILRDFTALHSI